MIERLARVKLVRPVSPITIRIQFDKRVMNDPFYLDPDNYVFSGGLKPLAVIIRGDKTVDVQTTPQDVDQLYELVLKNDHEGQENQATG